MTKFTKGIFLCLLFILIAMNFSGAKDYIMKMISAATSGEKLDVIKKIDGRKN